MCDRENTLKHLLAAIDFSDVSETVIALAEEMAKLSEASLTLLHVVPPEPDFVGYKVGPPSVRENLAKEIRQEHHELLAWEHRLRANGVHVEARLLQGPIGKKILEEANRLPADLLLLGSHGHGALTHLLVGSVGEEVLRYAPCPVLIVPSRLSGRRRA